MRFVLVSVLHTTALCSGCPQPKPDPRHPDHKVDKDLIPRRVIFGNPKKSGLRLSPDGTRLSYLAPV